MKGRGSAGRVTLSRFGADFVGGDRTVSKAKTPPYPVIQAHSVQADVGAREMNRPYLLRLRARNQAGKLIGVIDVDLERIMLFSLAEDICTGACQPPAQPTRGAKP
jgi:hypothetical protein